LTHRVRKGETISSIASHYDVTAQELRSWNAGLGANIVPGQKLRVVSDITQIRSKAKKVKKGASVAQALRKTAPAAKAKPARIAQHP
jgi:membrane-bound lytic murein transglycosylase D